MRRRLMIAGTALFVLSVLTCCAAGVAVGGYDYPSKAPGWVGTALAFAAVAMLVGSWLCIALARTTVGRRFLGKTMRGDDQLDT